MSDITNNATGNSNTNGSAKRKERKERAHEALDEYEEEGLALWDRAKQTLLQPGVAGGVLGVGAFVRSLPTLPVCLWRFLKEHRN